MNWVREIAGWLLILIGLYLYLLCLSFLSDRQIVEGGIVASVGTMVFRGGIQLVKVSSAARVVSNAVRLEMKPRPRDR